MRTAREDVYEAIDSERDYQDHRWGNDHDAQETVGNFLIYIERYLQKAKDAFVDETFAEITLHEIRKIGALTVACMEQHGAPKRQHG